MQPRSQLTELVDLGDILPRAMLLLPELIVMGCGTETSQTCALKSSDKCS